MPDKTARPENPQKLLAPVIVTFLIVAIAGGIVVYSFTGFGARARAEKIARIRFPRRLKRSQRQCSFTRITARIATE